MAPRKPTKKFHVTTKEGVLFEADTVEDLNALLLNSVDSGTAALRDREEQLRRANISRTRRSDRSSSTNDRPSRRGNRFNQKEWFQLMEEDPVEGMKEILNHVFGVRDVVSAFQFSHETASGVAERFAGAEFLQSRPDFPATPENSAKLMNYVRERYTEDEDTTISARLLSEAFDDMVASGRIRPLTEAEQQEVAKQGTGKEKESDKEGGEDETIPGSPDDRSGDTDTGLEDELGYSEEELEDLPQEEFQKVLREKGLA